MSTDGAPLVQPVNFAFDHGHVVVRIGDGSMWETAPGRLVAFETDGIAHHRHDTASRAWSVLVRGLATPMGDVSVTGSSPPPPSPPRPVVPSPGGHLMAIRPDVVTGRRFRLHGPDHGADPEREGMNSELVSDERSAVENP
jgi:hypothetical protein